VSVKTLGRRWYLDLANQVRAILGMTHGGTGNAHGWARGTVKPCSNDTGVSIAIGSVVTMIGAWDDARIRLSNSVNDTLVLGVVVGSFGDDGEDFTATAPGDGDLAAVLISGTCQVLISAAVTRGQYAFSDGAGMATSSATLGSGAFGRFQGSASSGDATLVLFGAVSFAGAAASYGAPALTLSTSNAAGAASTGIRTDATVAIFDATVPVTQAFSDAAATGSAAIAARRDHKHGMPANPVSGGRVTFGTVISPAQLVADTNDWAPTGYAAATRVRFSMDSTHNLTGFSAGGDGDMIMLENIGTVTANLKHQNTGSSAANRFIGPADEDVNLPADAWIFAVYDGTTARWRLGDVDYATSPTTQAFGDVPTAGTMATHKHGMPAGPPAGTTGLAQYGSGVDSSLDMDGSLVPDTTLFTKASSVYTQQRDIEATTFRVRNGVTINTNGYKIFARTKIQVDSGGIIQNNGNDGGVGAANNPGAALTGNTVGNSKAGGSGATSGIAGNNGNATDTNGAGGGPGGTGGNSGGGQAGGTGGGARSSVNAGVTAPTQGGLWGAAGKARPFNVVGMVMGLWSNANLSGSQWWGGGAGGGGGGRATTGTGASGGGGGGGGVLVLLAPVVTNAGTIQCNGGVGGTSTSSVGGGGGGGGGGGLIGILTDSHTNTGTEQCLGGTKGASTGTGGAAVDGGPGNVVIVLNQ
jgi:hypothetical protein